MEPHPTVTQDVFVAGMTCAHYVASVTEELNAVDAVESVAVDLQPGGLSRVTIRSQEPLDAAVVVAAVSEAGYTLARDPS